MKYMKKKRGGRKERKPSLRTQGGVESIITVLGRGEGIVTHDGKEYIIAFNDLNTALDGDTVLVSLPHKGVLGAYVTSIKKRKRMKFAGTVTLQGKDMVVKADSKRMYAPIALLDQKKPYASGTKVIVRITTWKQGLPFGEVEETLGKQNDHATEMNSILFEHSIDTNFPPAATDEGEEFVTAWNDILNHELHIRKDLRTLPTYTIDPYNAKDFDDAISFRKLPNGNTEIGVHIADVSHFVTPNSALDLEARNRAFSVYLVDRTIPMLPESLSNNLCSLKPNVDRLAFSTLFELNTKNEVVSEWFGRSIIHSMYRFTYEEAQETILDPQKEHHEHLRTLNIIAKDLQRTRSKQGSIDFADSEVAFNLNPDGSVRSIEKKIRLDAHKLVEEFMLLANKRVAEFMEDFTKKHPAHIPLYFLYRVHDAPHKERMQTFGQFVRALGYSFPEAHRVSADDITSLLKKVDGTPEAGVIRTAALRTMSKAIYSTQNIGHFGLAFDTYTHFTSPIRRYADLVVHRLLAHALERTLPQKDFVRTLPRLSVHIAERELQVVDAERQSIRYKQVEFMQQHVGERRVGIISGMAEWGMYVEDESTKTEGLISLRSMKDDYYTFDKKEYALIGKTGKKKFQLGDQVAFVVTAVRLEERQIDYTLAPITT